MATWEDTAKRFIPFFRGRDSFTMASERDGSRDHARQYKKMCNKWPLFPIAGWDYFEMPVILKNGFNMAYRDPTRLTSLWWTALHCAGKVDDPSPTGHTVIVASDGLKDKSGLYHMGVRFVEDPGTMSRNSQRDFVVGKLSERNQFHMYCVANLLRLVYMYCVTKGIPCLWLSDYESLRAVSAGLIYAPGGACYWDVNQGMALNSPQTHENSWVLNSGVTGRCHARGTRLASLPRTEVVPVASGLPQEPLLCPENDRRRVRQDLGGRP